MNEVKGHKNKTRQFKEKKKAKKYFTWSRIIFRLTVDAILISLFMQCIALSNDSEFSFMRAVCVLLKETVWLA
jgi:hypothetical protein